MAEARGDQCRGCGMRVLPHVLQLLLSDTDEEVLRCEMCGRILYQPGADSPCRAQGDRERGGEIMMPKRAPMPRGGGLFGDAPPEAKAIAAHQANIDGGSRGNPGPAAYGVVVRDGHGEIVARLKKYIGNNTNNVAEYFALIAALDYAQTHGIRALRVECDSELVVKQMRGQYKVKNEDLRPLFERAKKMSQGLEIFELSMCGGSRIARRMRW